MNEYQSDKLVFNQMQQSNIPSKLGRIAHTYTITTECSTWVHRDKLSIDIHTTRRANTNRYIIDT
jgi:hypothetical protein